MSLAACSVQNENDKESAAAVNKASDLYKNNQVNKPDSLVTQDKNLFISKDAFKILKQTPLPIKFNKTVVYTSAVGETVSQSISNIAKLTDTAIAISTEAQAKLDANASTASKLVKYQGTLQQVLNQISNRYGLFWEYKDNAVKIYTLVTKVYPLDAPIGSFNIDNTMDSTTVTSSDSTSSSSSTGSSNSVDGTSGMNLDYSIEAVSPWEAATKTIENMLSADGKLTENAVEGYVTVTDTPTVQKDVDSYIGKINSRSNKKIAVRIDVYDVETSSTSDFGFDINALTDVLSDDVTLDSDATSIFNSATDASSITFQKNSDGGSVVLEALNTLGKASEVTGTTVYTISGQPAPVQSIEQESYLASVSTTSTETSTSTSLEPGSVVTGYSMMVTPRIQSNNQIMINLNLQISSLLSLEAFSATTGDDSEQIQLPNVRSKNFLESMILHSGQSILIAGFQDAVKDSSQASPTAVDAWYAGGAKSTNNVVDTTVIVITPYIIGD